MSFFNSIFKVLKTTTDVCVAGMESLSKDLKTVSKELEDATEFQKSTSEARLGYDIINIILDNIDKAADLHIKMVKENPDYTNEVDRILQSFPKNNEKKTVWPAMPRTIVKDQLLQERVDNQHKEYLLLLEDKYKFICRKCIKFPEYENIIKKKLIEIECPPAILVRICPSEQNKNTLWDVNAVQQFFNRK